jgi:hypothetical protein
MGQWNDFAQRFADEVVESLQKKNPTVYHEVQNTRQRSGLWYVKNGDDKRFGTIEHLPRKNYFQVGVKANLAKAVGLTEHAFDSVGKGVYFSKANGDMWRFQIHIIGGTTWHATEYTSMIGVLSKVV